MFRRYACLQGLSLLLAMGLVLSGCGKGQEVAKPVVRLATTTSTVGSGLLKELVPIFEQESGCTVEVLALGTGASLQAARDGRADVVLVHARAAEDAFIEEGYGINRRDVMYNDFVLLGPMADPAQLAESRSIIDALKKISKEKNMNAYQND